MSLYDRICKSLQNSGVRDVSILLNGKILTAAGGKTVYVELTQDLKNIVFYCRTISGEKPNQVSVKTEVEVLSVLRKEVCSTTLFGIEVGGRAEEDNCSVSIDSDMRFLIIESYLFGRVKQIASIDTPQGFKLGDTMVSPVVCDSLKRAFIKASYSMYGDLVYRRGSNKFTNKLHRKKEFYNIQRVFIPVLIDYKAVYNPLRYNAGAMESALLKKAVNLNRYRERGNVSCYYLTHKEVCEALHMDHFMRFSSSFLYKVFIGLLFPDNEDFPAANREIWVRDEAMESKFRISYNVVEFTNLVTKNRKIVEDANSSSAAKLAAAEALEQLDKYQKKSSLLYACEKERTALMGIGSISLDDENKKTAQAYYSYLQKASLI